MNQPPVTVTPMLQSMRNAYTYKYTEPEEKHERRWRLSVNMKGEDHENSAVWGCLEISCG